MRKLDDVLERENDNVRIAYGYTLSHLMEALGLEPRRAYVAAYKVLTRALADERNLSPRETLAWGTAPEELQLTWTPALVRYDLLLLADFIRSPEFVRWAPMQRGIDASKKDRLLEFASRLEERLALSVR